MTAIHDEGEWERRDDADRDEHPGCERDDQASELLPDAVAVGAAEYRLGEVWADDGDNSGRPGDRDEPEPRRRLDMSRRAPRIQPRPRERNRRDECERRGRDCDHRRPGDVGVAEARHRADTLVGGEREADEISPLLRKWERDAGQDGPEPREWPAQVAPHDTRTDRPFP